MMSTVSMARICTLAFIAGLCGAPCVNAGSLVTISTNVGNIDVELFDGVATNTVNNFLSLVTNGNYTNTIIHRSSPANQVIQGGGFDTSFDSIPNNGDIALEYTVAHTRGTLGMARSSLPNSANSQWFINTGDNSSNWAPKTGSDGYAAFGWVTSGMDVVDAIAALPRYNLSNLFGGTFTETPLKDVTGSTFSEDFLIVVNSITVTGQHNSFQNPNWNVDINNDGAATTSDLLSLVNSLLANGRKFSADATHIGTNYKYFDPNGDGFVSTSDLLVVVNALLRGDTAPASNLVAPLDSPAVAPLTVVPEPSTWALALSAVLSFTALIHRKIRMARQPAAMSK